MARIDWWRWLVQEREHYCRLTCALLLRPVVDMDRVELAVERSQLLDEWSRALIAEPTSERAMVTS